MPLSLQAFQQPSMSVLTGCGSRHYQEGRQLAWLLSCPGVWMAAVEVEIISSNSAVSVTSGLMVPAEAIQPAQKPLH